jgi:hypothetical protein
VWDLPALQGFRTFDALLVEFKARFAGIISGNRLTEAILKIQPAIFAVRHDGQSQVFLKVNRPADFSIFELPQFLKTQFSIVSFRARTLGSGGRNKLPTTSFLMLT